MALPKINTGRYKTKIPSTGQEIEYRPYLVADEKYVLMAKAAGDSASAIEATFQLLENCILTEGVNVRGLEAQDVEFLFLKIRIESVGEEDEFVIKCEHCEAQNSVPFNFKNQIYLEEAKPVSENVSLGDGISIQLKRPTLADLATIKNDSEMESLYDIVDKTIQSVLTEDELIKFSESPKEERIRFIESMSGSQINKIKDFIEAVPKITADLTFVCGSCNKENEIKLQGIDAFFQ